MENVDTLRLPVDNGLYEAQAMLDKRGVVGPETVFAIDDPTITLRWAFARGTTGALAVNVLNKSTAVAINAAFENAENLDELVVVYLNNCTPDGAKELVPCDVFAIDHLYLNPLKMGYLMDAGLYRDIATDTVPTSVYDEELRKMVVKNVPLLQVIGGDPEKCKGINLVDALAKYLGAKAGQVVWTNDRWGTLEPSITYRVARCDEE
jgi:DNA-directed RNA polymerase subunit H (RpoH/RPB5)